MKFAYINPLLLMYHFFKRKIQTQPLQKLHLLMLSSQKLRQSAYSHHQSADCNSVCLLHISFLLFFYSLFAVKWIYWKIYRITGACFPLIEDETRSGLSSQHNNIENVRILYIKIVVLCLQPNYGYFPRSSNNCFPCTLYSSLIYLTLLQLIAN